LRTALCAQGAGGAGFLWGQLPGPGQRWVLQQLLSCMASSAG